MIAGKSTPSNRHRKHTKKEEAEWPAPLEDGLDRALADTFLASDPPAVVIKGTKSNPRAHEKIQPVRKH